MRSRSSCWATGDRTWVRRAIVFEEGARAICAYKTRDRYNLSYVVESVHLMKSQSVKLTYEIDLQPGELLALPPELAASVGAGRWLVTIQPMSSPAVSLPTRNHDAFLHSYAPGDEGLYDDYTR